MFDVANGELSLTNQVSDRDSEVIYFEGFERFVSTDYDDLFIGSAADEVFVSGLGEDTLLAGDGNDILIPGNDDVEDILEAGEGDDILYVAREDSFIAGNGYDTLSFYDSVWVDATQNLISWDVSYAEQDGWSAPFDGEEVLDGCRKLRLVWRYYLRVCWQ